MFEFQPTLTGALVEARPLRESDFEALYAVASDPLVWEQHPNPDRCERPVFEAFFRDAMNGGAAFAIYDRASGDRIGSSRYHGFDAEKSVVEIGWSFLGRDYWGGTYNGDLKRIMLDHAFRFVNSVIFVIGSDNARSRRAVEKIGAVFDGVMVSPAGDERVVYRMTSARWAEVRAGDS